MKAPLGLLLAVLVLAGCADRSPQPVQAPSSARKSAPTAGRSAEPSISIPPDVPKTTKAEPPVDDFQQVVAEGRVRVSGSCVELVTDRTTWVLLGPAAAQLRDGRQARVTGVPDPNRETGCTGSPLLVSGVAPA
ncbi:hypothetical protein [Dactylosporangium sp. CA-233914]|uniref:hypothetical protein n=1 Tax=Dactylosporangium sp. CA-233914 TaxID=3239934 RepID=UPI003D8FAB6D